MDRRLALLFVLPLGGCAWIEKISTAIPELEQYLPTVTFDRFDVRDIDFDGIDADFVFKIDNPNPIELNLASLRYDLDLEGLDLLEGDQSDGLTLAAQGASEIELPVSVAFADVLALVGEVRGQDSVEFLIVGGMGFNTPAGPVEVPFEETGDFPVLRAPKISFDKIRVDGVNLLQQQAELAVDLKLSHDQGSPLGFASFDYDLLFSDTPVAEGSVRQFAEVAAGAEEVVTLPVEIQLLDLGSSIVNAITKKEALDAKLSAQVEVDTPFGVVPLSFDTSDRLTLQ